jgi:hypothetical protein
MKRGMTRLCFTPLYRLIFGLIFVVGLPFYSVLGCFLNIRPWLRHNPLSVVYWPLMQLIWLVKGFAVLEAIILQKKAFRLD